MNACFGREERLLGFRERGRAHTDTIVGDNEDQLRALQKAAIDAGPDRDDR